MPMSNFLTNPRAWGADNIGVCGWSGSNSCFALQNRKQDENVVITPDLPDHRRQKMCASRNRIPGILRTLTFQPKNELLRY